MRILDKTCLFCCCCSKSLQYSRSSKLELPPHFEQLKIFYDICLLLFLVKCHSYGTLMPLALDKLLETGHQLKHCLTSNIVLGKGPFYSPPPRSTHFSEGELNESFPYLKHGRTGANPTT